MFRIVRSPGLKFRWFVLVLSVGDVPIWGGLEVEKGWGGGQWMIKWRKGNERDDTESSHGKRLRGDEVTWRKETGRRETGGTETGGKSTGRKATGAKETGERETGGDNQHLQNAQTVGTRRNRRNLPII